MKCRVLKSFVFAFALLTAVPLARAQLVVIDPTNLIENALTAARELEQIANQVHSLENEAVMLRNEARNLTSLPTSVLARLARDTIDHRAIAVRSPWDESRNRSLADRVHASLSRRVFAHHVERRDGGRCQGTMDQFARSTAYRDCHAGTGDTQPAR